MEIEGLATAPAFRPVAVMQNVSSGFFQLTQIPIREGRGFTAADRGGTPAVAVVSQAFANRYWPGETAVGKRVRLGAESGAAPWLEVVGVAGNILYDWTQRVPEPVVYRPIGQAPSADAIFAVRSAADSSSTIGPAKQAIAAIDPLLPAFNVMSLSDAIAQSFAGTSQVLGMMAILGLLALVIAVIGIYGIVAYTVAARTREFGVRIALGARRADIFAMVMRHAAVLSMWGIGAGAVMAIAATRLTRAMAFAASSQAPGLTLAIAVLLAVTAAIACLVPARRAMQADPVSALRTE